MPSLFHGISIIGLTIPTNQTLSAILARQDNLIRLSNSIPVARQLGSLVPLCGAHASSEIRASTLVDPSEDFLNSFLGHHVREALFVPLFIEYKEELQV
jgi:hypothetical protein